MTVDQPPPPPSLPRAEWYPDPANAAQLRWWDGSAWTEHVHPVATVQPFAGYRQEYGAAPTATPLSVGFGEAISRGFRGWKDYSGRATQGEYWWFFLFVNLVSIIPAIVWIGLIVAAIPSSAFDPATSSTTTQLSAGMITSLVVGYAVIFVIGIAILVFQLPLSVRRLHDTDREGWWYLLGFVPFGSFVLLVFLAMPGTPYANRYGPVPVRA